MLTLHSPSAIAACPPLLQANININPFFSEVATTNPPAPTHLFYSTFRLSLCSIHFLRWPRWPHWGFCRWFQLEWTSPEHAQVSAHCPVLGVSDETDKLTNNPQTTTLVMA